MAPISSRQQCFSFVSDIKYDEAVKKFGYKSVKGYCKIMSPISLKTASRNSRGGGGNSTCLWYGLVPLFRVYFS